MASKRPIITLASLAALALALGVAGCASTPEPIAPPPAAGLPAYTIGAGDRIQVSVYNDNDLTGEYEVDERGSIVMPLVGAVDLQGQSLRDSEQTITSRIRVYRAAAGSGNAPEIVSDGLVLPGDVIVVTERIL